MVWTCLSVFRPVVGVAVSWERKPRPYEVWVGWGVIILMRNNIIHTWCSLIQKASRRYIIGRRLFLTTLLHVCSGVAALFLRQPNHHPIILPDGEKTFFNKPLYIRTKPGKTVSFDTRKSYGPDSNVLSIQVFLYREASNFSHDLRINNDNGIHFIHNI